MPMFMVEAKRKGKTYWSMLDSPQRPTDAEALTELGLDDDGGPVTIKEAYPVKGMSGTEFIEKIKAKVK